MRRTKPESSAAIRLIIGGHQTVQRTAGAYGQDGSVDVAPYTAGRTNLDAPYGIDVAENRTGDLDRANLDVGIYAGAWADHEGAFRGDRSMEIAIDSKYACEIQLAGDGGFLVTKSENLGRFFEV